MLWADGPSLLPGDAVGVVALAVGLALPMGLASLLAAWRPRLGGLVVGLWLLPWALWFAEAELLRQALPVVLLVPLVFGGVGWRWPGTAWALLALGAVLVGLRAESPRDVGAPLRPDEACGAPSVGRGRGEPLLVLVTLDTVRADHLGAIGGARFAPPTPHLDALAARGLLLGEGVAPAPLTGPAHTAMLTGCDPLELGVLRNGVVVPEGVGTVAEALRGQGYRTGAFLGATVLDRRVGLSRGFDHYDDRFDAWHRLQGTWPRRLLARMGWVPERRQRSGGEVVARALRWVAEGEGPTFLWVHLYDAHHPYDPDPSWLDAVVDTAPAGTGSEADVLGWRDWSRAHHRVPELPGLGPRGDLSHHARAYAAEVAEVDALVGRLLDALPGAAVLVASDHGESLTEHGYLFNHGGHTYQPTVRVPMIAVGPGFEPGTRSDDPTPGRRVAGTLLRWGGLDAVGLETPYLGPIESLAVGQEARSSLRLARISPELAVREGATKHVVRLEQSWRFDLEQRLQELRERGRPVAEGLEELGYVE